MVMQRQTILEEALKLPPAERADVAAALLDSLDDATVELAEEVQRAWAAENERRARQVIAENSQGRPWDEVRSEIESGFRKR